MTVSLPEPDADQRAHSERLAALIRAQIAEAGGSIPFSRYMELALYAPGLGYYSAGSSKLGAEGDFVTAPELGPTFARCTANALAPVLREIGPQAQFVELGGGTGAFAFDALLRLAELDALPAHYALLEPSADLRERQRARLAELPAGIAARLRWLDAPPQAPWQGVLFANEVLDALPTTRFEVRGGEAWEQHVVVDAHGRFAFEARPADALVAGAVAHLQRRLDAPLPEGYASETLPQLPYWIQAVAGTLGRGAMLFVDYGYPRREYYLPERGDGTLVCHYRHRAHADPFHLPGLQDLTAFVDFTALVESGTHAGFDFAGYCSQASFLIGNGLAGELAAIERIEDVVLRQRRLQQVKRLTLPGEMGERFQAMGFVREVDLEHAFAEGDLSRRL
ncbi:class I SAM-dependent methyltransferase [Coralloluteibacterium stylophorae]|uniref:SAM-dependent methyltransferase n=1 Tax=Coralloluteibacterium stylophorae TaxID=1776034 RepID=A0A8J7VU67_9GAMM|nr:SAM-dependent methyltransferase [Coralloluteibacterium stylophorae]MBS7458045.1 SAM-dependent methyltransferase [Coralloluteibacterium stylophorae]